MKSPLSFHALTNCKFRNRFVLIFIQNARGVPSSSTFGRSDLRTFQRVSELSPFLSNPCALFRTFLQFFACIAKLNSFVFNRFRTLCAKTPGGGGSRPLGAGAGLGLRIGASIAFSDGQL